MLYVYVIFLMIKNNAISFDMIFEIFNGIIYFQCQSAALDELFGKGGECFQRYHTAQILLHSLAQHVSHSQDRALLIKCTYYFRSVSSSLTNLFIFFNLKNFEKISSMIIKILSRLFLMIRITSFSAYIYLKF